MKATNLGTVLLLFALFTSAVCSPTPAHAQTYYLRSNPVPFPFDPYDGAEPIIVLDYNRHIYQVLDNSNDYEMLITARELDRMSAPSTTTSTSTSTTTATTSSISIDPSSGGTNTGTGGTYTNYFQSYVFGSNDLWLEETQIDWVSGYTYLTLHGTIPADRYQLLSTNVLSSDGQHWTLGDIIFGAADTNESAFTVYLGTNSQMFYRAHHANQVLAIQRMQDAIEPNPFTGDPGQIGDFQLYSRYPLTNDLVVHYLISGTAQNGFDYSPLSGSVTLTPDNTSTNIEIAPLFDSQVDGVETVTLTIQPTNTYLIDPAYSSATITIADSSTVVEVHPHSGDIIKPDGPPGEPAQPGQFYFHRGDSVRGLYPPLTVYYSVSGTATNGEDYALLSGSIDFTNDQYDAFLDVNPLSDVDYEGIQNVTVTLIPTNSYLVYAPASNATLNIDDSSTTVEIQKVQDAIETNTTLRVGQTGIFQVTRVDTRSDFPQMTVNYQITGTASNGVDYQTLSGTVTFADGIFATNIYVQTIQDDLLEGDETVTLTIVPNGNAYLIDNTSNATVIIHDTIPFLTVASLNAPIGIDYYAPSNSLIVSYNYNGGSPTFARVYTNITVSGGVTVTNVAVTNWSGVGGLSDEVYLTVVKASGVSAGFTNADMYYGSGFGIGWLSADSTRSNINWCVLTNSVSTNTGVLRGGICMDQTGTFGNKIIAVTSSSAVDGSSKGIWLVDPHAQPTLLTNINTPHLEGVTTLTNDVQKWGPWAGKIITGDESHTDPTTGGVDPVIYTIATNGAVTMTETMPLVPGGIFPEDFEVIPANQNLYITVFDKNIIMELPAHYLAPYVGDLLVAQAGMDEPSGTPGLFIIRWDSQSTNFVTTSIALSSIIGHIEHTTFAPIAFPGH